MRGVCTPLLFLYNHSMGKLGVVYFADVSKIEDNVAHLLEHCITTQLYERLRHDNLDLFDCYSTTTPSNIIFDITAYGNAVADAIAGIMNSLEPMPASRIDAEINRIELEDDLPLHANDLEKVRGIINSQIAHIHFDTASSINEIPEQKDGLIKPDNSLLVYSLGAREWTLSILLPDNTDDMLVDIINCLAGRFLRCEDIYALHYEVVNGRVEYSFRTSKLTEQSDLDRRWQNVVKDFIAGGLDVVLGNINVSGDIATKIRRTIDSLTASIATASTTLSQVR